MNEALDRVTAALVAPPFSAPSPTTVLFLLRRYAMLGQEHVRAVVEAGLTEGLKTFEAERDPRERCQWVGAFAAAAEISDDDRLAPLVERSLAPIIDGLEGFVRSAYEPGEGMLGGSLVDQMRCALALLVAFELTGRLPYSMLAEELVQTARRRWWNEDEGRFRGDFHANYLAAQLLCRLGALHRDGDYTAGAVVAHEATYLDDATRVFAWLAPAELQQRHASADYGLALLDALALQSQIPPR